MTAPPQNPPPDYRARYKAEVQRVNRATHREMANDLRGFVRAGRTITSPRPVLCPWNPFPHDSYWGRKINEMYTRDLGRRL